MGALHSCPFFIGYVTRAHSNSRHRCVLSYIIMLSHPFIYSNLRGGKCLTYIGTEGSVERSIKLHLLEHDLGYRNVSQNLHGILLVICNL